MLGAGTMPRRLMRLWISWIVKLESCKVGGKGIKQNMGIDVKPLTSGSFMIPQSNIPVLAV
jgi:hypothetical protein